MSAAGPPSGRLRDGLLLAFGTLTAVRVPAPRVVDRGVAGVAMAAAPLVGVVLAALVAVPAALLVELGRPPLLVAALAVGALALLTRAIHLDGLADTADGLGSARRDEAAREIMRRSDIGPFGVVTLLLLLVLQVVALAHLLALGPAPGGTALAVALLGSRATLVWLCTPGFGAARADGLGVVVAGSVGAARAVAALVVTVAVGAALVGLVLVAGDPGGEPVRLVLALALGGVVGQVMALGLARRCVGRFGGVTGDVYGACVEVAATATLVVTVLAL